MSLAVGVRAFSFTRLLFRTTTFDKIPTIVKLISRGAFFFQSRKGRQQGRVRIASGRVRFLDRPFNRSRVAMVVSAMVFLIKSKNCFPLIRKGHLLMLH